MDLLLHDWGPSPFCLKVRSILEYKGLPYRRRTVDPLSIVRLVRRGRIGKVPALEVDGRLVVDSTRIALELERLAPEPTLLPVGARDRALCHAIEEWADESLYFLGLYFQWIEPRGARAVPAVFRGPNRLLYPIFNRRVRNQVRGQGTGRKPHDMLRSELETHLDHAVALLDAPCLFGDTPTLADFALGPQLVYLSRTPEAGPRIAARPRLQAYLEHLRSFRRPAS